MSNQEQPKPSIEQQAENSTLGSGMMANQGDKNNQIQGDNNIQQQNNNQAQINRDGSTGIQVKANGGSNNIAKEINQYNNCTIVIGHNGGNSGNNRKEYNFQAYLSNIIQKYQHWSNDYTLTSALDKRVDMGLKPQLIPSQKDGIAPYGEQNENIETLPLIEAISKYAREHVLLVGKPGSGKSTALQRLLWETADKIIKGENKLDVIPVLVELRAWQTQTTCVSELIQKIFRQNSLRLTKEEIADLLFDGRFLLLLDGLNELPNDESRRIVADFQAEYPQTEMIFTTRDLGIGGDFGVKKQLSMQPLTAEQMRQFVRAYLPEQGEGMLEQLGDRLRELGETPLILKMLCDVFDEIKQIPNSRGGLFRYFDREFDKLKGQVAVTDKLRQWKAELLQNLAFAMMRGEKITDLRLVISRTQAEDILEELLQGRVNSPGEKAKDWLLDLLKHYLIQTVDGKEIQFHHQLFQEYYAAEYLLRILPELSDEELKKDYLNLLKWTEPLALMLALVGESSQAVRVVRLALDVDLMLGARLAGEVKFEFQEKTVGFILEKKLHKIIEIDFLGITRSEFAVNSLINALNDEDSSFRWRAADALGEIGNEAAVNILINALNHEDSNVRYNAQYALIRIDNKAVINYMINALDKDDLFIRQAAAHILGQIGDKATINFLINALNHEDSSVRQAAAKALGKIGNEVAVNALIHALYDEDSSVRISATKALGQIRNEAAVNALIHALYDEDSSVRISATEALGQIRNEAAVNALIHALYNEDSSVRISATEALGQIRNEAAANALIHALYNEDSSVRISATKALGQIRNEAAANLLINALNDEDKLVRVESAYALYKIISESESAIKALINALNHEDSCVRISATKALGQIRNEAAVNLLINALNDEDKFVRINAASALSKIENEAAVNLLINALNDEDKFVRINAASALSKIGNEAAVNLLINTLSDNCFLFYNRAAKALGEIANEAAVNALINALNNKYSNVRSSAVDALGEIGNEAAVNALINALNDEDSYVRWRAADALGKIGNEAAVNALINALNNEDSSVRWRAADALGEIIPDTKIAQIWYIILNGADEQARAIILKAQERYKFYNHEIFYSPPIPSHKNPENYPTYYDFRGANFPGVANFNKNYGNQIGTQNNIPKPNNET